MEDENGELDALQPTGDDEDTLTPQADAETNDEKDYKALYESQKVRAEKAEAKLKKADEPVAEPAQQTPAQPNAAFDEKVWDLKTDLKMAGYTAEEIRFIQSNAPNGDITQAVETKSGKLTPKDEFVNAGILAMRKKAQVGQGTQPPSKRASVEAAVQTFKETKPEEREAKYSPDAWRRRREG